MAGHKQGGSRRAPRAPRSASRFRPSVLVLAAAVTLCVVAWGYLVYAAIDFGVSARNGGASSAWGLLALASLGAIACLFVALMLIARLASALGLGQSGGASGPPDPAAPSEPVAPRPPRVKGGKRAAR